jgi:hypothetical protein
MKPGGEDTSATGVYSEEATAALEQAGPQHADAAGALYPDRNIFEWYERRLPPRLPDAHLIDWGAGPGRFAPLYLRRHPRRLTLVEPSPSGYERLLAQYRQVADVEVLNASIGAQVERCAAPSDVLHLCNFVVNCLDHPGDAFRLFAESVRGGEQLIVFTNVFIPPTLAGRLRWDSVLEEMEFDLRDAVGAAARLPRSPTFANQIIESGVVLVDSVHVIAEYVEILRDGAWQVVKTSLLPPCGFRHLLRPGDDFGDMVFAVLSVELERSTER